MKKILLLLIVAILVLPPPALGCTIPVFRYALEKWDLTPYEIVVFHRGDLPGDVQKSLDRLGKSKWNVDLTVVDLAGKVAPNLSNNLRNTWKREAGDKEEPWMQVRYQGADRIGLGVAWSGPCTNANLQNVLDSPQRQALVNHLKGGASTVFVLLTSGNEQADKAAHAMVLKQLQFMEKKIKLPVQSKDGPQMKLPLPLKVDLPIVVVDRSAPAEAAFVKMLLATEEDLDKVKGPILLPVFGRGRVLGSLYGKELDEVQVSRATEFLCRECSCQIKELNPGVDMLMPADWNAIFDKMFEAKKPAPPEKKRLP